MSRLVSPSLGPPIAQVTSVSPPSRSSPRQPHLSVHGTLADVPGRHLEDLSPARISMPLMSSPANPAGGWCVGSLDSSGALAMEAMPTGHAERMARHRKWIQETPRATRSPPSQHRNNLPHISATSFNSSPHNCQECAKLQEANAQLREAHFCVEKQHDVIQADTAVLRQQLKHLLVRASAAEDDRDALVRDKEQLAITNNLLHGKIQGYAAAATEENKDAEQKQIKQLEERLQASAMANEALGESVAELKQRCVDLLLERDDLQDTVRAQEILARSLQDKIAALERTPPQSERFPLNFRKVQSDLPNIRTVDKSTITEGTGASKEANRNEGKFQDPLDKLEQELRRMEEDERGWEAAQKKETRQEREKEGLLRVKEESDGEKGGRAKHEERWMQDAWKRNETDMMATPAMSGETKKDLSADLRQEHRILKHKEQESSRKHQDQAIWTRSTQEPSYV